MVLNGGLAALLILLAFASGVMGAQRARVGWAAARQLANEAGKRTRGAAAGGVRRIRTIRASA